jgi:hypothetical protein
MVLCMVFVVGLAVILEVENMVLHNIIVSKD